MSGTLRFAGKNNSLTKYDRIMLHMKNKYINNFLSSEPFLRISISTKEVGRWFNDKIGYFKLYSISNKEKIYRCHFNEMFITCCSTMDKHLYWHPIENQDTEDKGRGFIIGFLHLHRQDNLPTFLKRNLIDLYEKHNYPLNNLDLEIKTIIDVYKYYYKNVRIYSYNLLDDDDFHEQLLKDENEHYLYMKERLFPFFDEEAREILIKFTRKFFKYAREQGCVGEFVEDVKNEVVNNVVVDEMDIKLEKVNRIINLLNKEWTIGVKKHIPFNLIDTGIIYSSIVEFIKNDKLEIRYTIDTNKKSSQHRNFALKYCTKILFSTDENNENWWIFLSKLFNIQLNSIKKSIREANPEMDFQKAVEDIFKD